MNYATYGHRIALWRNSEKLAQRDVGKEIGVSQGYLSDIENGRSGPSRAFLSKLSERYGLSPTWVLEGTGPMKTGTPGFGGGSGASRIEPPDRGKPLAGDFTADGQDFALVRRFDLDVSAGPGLVALDDNAADRLALSRQWLMARGLSADLCALVRVKGDSMEPTIPDGALVLINAAERQIPKPGIYAFNLDGHSYIKRIAPASVDATGRANSLVLISDNATYPPRHLAGADLDTFKAVGRIRAAFIDL